jgi:error-prone DNA polymerase
MAYRRAELKKSGIRTAAELKILPHGRMATTAGCVITRQRPGTAKGLIFMTLEDETGHARVIVKPDFYAKNPHDVLYAKFVQVWGSVQNQDGIVHLVAKAIRPLAISAAETSSHDFH